MINHFRVWQEERPTFRLRLWYLKSKSQFLERLHFWGCAFPSLLSFLLHSKHGLFYLSVLCRSKLLTPLVRSSWPRAKFPLPTREAYEHQEIHAPQATPLCQQIPLGRRNLLFQTYLRFSQMFQIRLPKTQWCYDTRSEESLWLKVSPFLVQL